MTTGQTIRSLRKKRRLSQAQLGALCGISGATVAAYERGDRLPKKKVLEKLAAAFEVPVSKLTESPITPLPLKPLRRSDAALYGAILNALEERCISVQSKMIVGSTGKSEKYYVAEGVPNSFVLYESDITALARSAGASMLPMVERMRQAQQEKLG